MRKEGPGSVTRREVLLGAGSLAVAARAIGSESPAAAPHSGKFDTPAFVDDCLRANDGTAGAQAAVREVLARALADPASVLAGVGEPLKGGLQALHRSAGLTILNIVWSPWMQLLPHDHNMWALIGIYTGREDNIFWERRDARRRHRARGRDRPPLGRHPFGRQSDRQADGRHPHLRRGLLRAGTDGMGTRVIGSAALEHPGRGAAIRGVERAVLRTAPWQRLQLTAQERLMKLPRLSNIGDSIVKRSSTVSNTSGCV
jgi:hypothetical protein